MLTEDYLVDMIRRDAVPNIKTLINLKAKPILFDRTTSGKVVDINDDFKGFMNKFVINHMLKNEKSKLRFLGLISDTFGPVISSYNMKNRLKGNNAVVLLYKGGNLLRIFYKRFLSNFAVEANINIAAIVDDVFAADFGKSDDDFTILINPELPMFDKIHADMNYLSFACLEIIRKKLQSDPDYYFDYFKLDTNEKKSVLATALKAAVDDNGFKSLSDPSSPYYQFEIVGILLGDIYTAIPPKNITMNKYRQLLWRKSDDQVKYLSELYPIEYPTLDSVKKFAKFDSDTDPKSNFASSSRNDFFILPIDNKAAIYPSVTIDKNVIYVSHNDIIFDDPTGVVSFVLNRSKINARIYLKKSVFSEPVTLAYVSAPGELIDITIANRNDIGLKYMYSTGFSRNLTEYVFSNTDDFHTNSQFIFTGYSHDYLIHDLENMLFGQTQNQPWTDKKYEKRLKRLIFIEYLKLLAMYGPTRTTEIFRKIERHLIDADNCFKTGTKECEKYISMNLPVTNPMHTLVTFIESLYQKKIDGEDIDHNATKFLHTVTKLVTQTRIISEAVQSYDNFSVGNSFIPVSENYLGGSNVLDSDIIY